MNENLPVMMAVRRSDGTVEQVRVGSAVKTQGGFTLTLEPMHVGEGGLARAAAGAFKAPAAISGAGGGGGGGGGADVFPNYGRSKGQPIAGATMQDLEYYASGCRRTLGDAAKARFHEKEKVLLAAIEAEMARQGGSASPPDEVPPPTDDDAPF